MPTTANDLPPGFEPGVAVAESPPGFEEAPAEVAPEVLEFRRARPVDEAMSATEAARGIRPARPLTPAPPEGSDAERKAAYLRWQSRQSKATPEQAASAVRIAAATGRPADLVLAGLPTFEAEAAAGKYDWQALAEQHPELADILTQDPARFALVKDSSADLAGVQDLILGRWRSLSDADGGGYTPPPWLAMGRDSFKNEMPLVGRQYAQAFTAPGAVEPLKRAWWAPDLVRVAAADWGPVLSKTDPAWRAENQAEIERLAREVPAAKDYGPSTRGLAGQLLYAPVRMARVVALNVGAAAAGGAVGGPVGAFAGPFAYNFAEMFGPLALELQQTPGVDAHEALAIGAIGAAVGSAAASAPLGSIVRKLPGAAQVIERATVRAGERILAERTVGQLVERALSAGGKDYAAGVAGMAIQSGAAQAAREAAKVAGDPTYRPDFEAIVGASVEGGKAAAVDLLPLVAAGQAHTFLRDLGRRSSALESQATIQGLVEQGAKLEQLIAAAPAEARRIIGEMAKGSPDGKLSDTIFADLAGWQSYAQKQKVDPRQLAAEVMGDGGAAYDKAVQERAERLAIPTADFVAKMTTGEGAKHGEGLLADLATGADTATPRQVAEETKRRAARFAELKTVALDKMEADQRRVAEAYQTQALAAGEDGKVAEANAHLYSAALKVLAERAGRGESAWDLWEQNTLQIMRGEPGQLAAAAQGERMAQGPTVFKKEGDRGALYASPAGPGETVRFSLHLLNADRSTLAHESFHALSVLLGQLATREDAQAGLRTDYQKLLDAMGYKDHGERLSANDAKKEERASHLWEMYLAEGKAPSAELLTAFARMKTWLRRIYSTATGKGIGDQYRKEYGQELALSDDVRDLFARMLAGEDAVADAAREAKAEAPAVKFTPEEQAESDRLQAEARAQAEADIQRQMVEEERGTDREFMRAARTQVEHEVAARLEEGDRVYAAQAALERGELHGMPLKLALDPEALRGELGPEVLAEVPRAYMDAKEGLPPDVVASMLGFDSGAEMIRQLIAAEPRAARLRRETSDVIRERYPRLSDRPALLRDAARTAMGSDAALRDGLLRLRAMEREAGLPPTRSSPAAIRASAAEAVKGKTYTELRADRYDAAARSFAGRAAEIKDPQLRRDAFEAYLFNVAMAKAAREARAQIEKDARHLQAFTLDAKRAKVGQALETAADGTISQPYLDKIDGLLDAFELRASATLKDVRSRDQQRAALEKWAAERWADGDSIVIPPSVMETLQRAKHWKDLTAQELADLRTAVDSIAQQADLRRKFRFGGEKVDTSRVVDELQAAALANGAKVRQRFNDETVRTWREKLAELKRQGKHMVEAPELLFDALDGFDPNGPWKKYVWRTLSDASYRYHDLVRKTAGRVQKVLEGLTAADRARLRETPFTVDGNEYTLENAIVAALNCGNESNLTKMVRGMSDPRTTGLFGITPWFGRGTLEKILEHLTAKDIALVNEIHRTLESLRPEMERLEKEEAGLAPQWVQAKPFKFIGADGAQLTIDGGYYPMIYGRKTRVGKTQAEAETLAANGMPGLFQPGYDRAMTPQGHLEKRVENFARPIALTLDGLPRKLTSSAKDIAFRMPGKQLYRVLMDERIVGALAQALGDKGADLVMAHLRDAVNDVMLPDAGEALALKAIGKARGLAYRSIFSLNVPQALQNLADWAGVQAVVPQRYAMAAALRIAKDIPGERAWILERSPEMRIRADGMLSLGRDLQNVFRRTELGLAWDRFGELAMIPFETTQAMVEFPVWRGSYDHALAQGQTEAAAARHADDMVRRMFGGRRTVDLTPIQRGVVTRHLTMFWGWAGAQLNQFIRAREQAGVAWSSGAKWKALGLLGSSFATLGAKMVLSELLTGKGPKDEDGDDSVDAADVGRWVAFRAALAVPSTMPLGVGAGIRQLAGGGPARDVSLTPWTNALNASFKALSATRTAAMADELDEEQELNLFLAWMEAGGALTGAPVTQARGSIRYWVTRPEGATVVTDVLGSVYGRDRAGQLSHLTLPE